jgi:hypothetical protein
MPVPALSPDRLVLEFLRRNRWDEWRARGAETLFTALSAAAFAGFALWVIDPWWSRLLAPDSPWMRTAPAMLLAVATALALVWRAHRRHRALAQAQRDDWLAAMPIAPAMRAQARRRVVALSTAITLAGMLALLAWVSLRIGQVVPPVASIALAAGIGAAIGAVLPATNARPVDTSKARQRAVAVAIAPGTAGLALLGAALEPIAARLPRSAPWVALAFMLFPPSTPLIAVFGLMLLFTSLALALDLIAHWRERYLADAAWLAALPLAPGRLLGAYRRPLLRRGSMLVLLFGACVHALGAPALFAAALALLLAAAMLDAVLCAYATRGQPSRYSLLLMLHGASVFATVQVLPPAAPLIYAACLWQAWRKGNS